MDLQIKGKKALVTGSSAGIGLEIARKLATEGASVIVSGRDQAKLEQAVDSIRQSGAAEIAGIVADITTAEGTDFLFRQVPEVDILVNNLGIYESKPSPRSRTPTGSATST
jgi:short-subunit dehydrogenase